jgi:hypothetical protein
MGAYGAGPLAYTRPELAQRSAPRSTLARLAQRRCCANVPWHSWHEFWHIIAECRARKNTLMRAFSSSLTDCAYRQLTNCAQHPKALQGSCPQTTNWSGAVS